eukprot:2501118-Amphidinium_carterae.1
MAKNAHILFVSNRVWNFHDAESRENSSYQARVASADALQNDARLNCNCNHFRCNCMLTTITTRGAKFNLSMPEDPPKPPREALPQGRCATHSIVQIASPTSSLR